MAEVYDVGLSIRSSIDAFYLDRDGRPMLVPLGFPDLDDSLGGLAPGACGILAGATGVGKSSAMLAAILRSEEPVGIVSMEDGADVVGTRLLSAFTGIDSLRIRRKQLTPEELRAINAVEESEKDRNIYFTFPIAGSIGDIEDAVAALCDKGCRMVWLDYLQKVRGHHDDRLHEVAETFTRFQRAVARGGAAGMAVSQFRRFGADERIPQIYHLKESGDLENEARIIVLVHRFTDEHGVVRVRFRVGKSTYGGEDIFWDMVRDPGGTLRAADVYDPLENF
jgi:replicative DNA helicase